MSYPNPNKGTPSSDPNPPGRYFYSGSRRGIVFVAPNTEEMQKDVFGGLFRQGWRFATDEEIHEYTHSHIPSYPVQEPQQPAQPEPEPEPEPEPQRQPAVTPTPRRTAVAEPEPETERETEATEDAAQEIARLKHQLHIAVQKLAETQREA